MNLLRAVLILAAAVTVAVGAMLIVRRTAPEGSYFEDGDRASGVFGVLSTGFAIFAGFVIFLAFTSYDQSRSGAEVEALVVVQQCAATFSGHRTTSSASSSSPSRSSSPG